MATNVIIEVSKAEFTIDSWLFQNLDSRAKIEWSCPKDGVSLLSLTRTHRNNNSFPIWHFRCRPNPYRNNGEKVILTVENKNRFHGYHYFASVSVSVEELLSRPKGNTDIFHKLRLTNTSNQKLGIIYARAVSCEMKEKISIDFSSMTPCKMANNSLFEMPVSRLGVSGGTAPFFKLKLKNPSNGQRPDEYIGKDLAHAVDEFDFYEKLQYLKKHGGMFEGLESVLNFAFDYGGVIHAVDDEGKERDLLVLKNLHAGCKKLRMLDLKIGFVTADAGWQGKSRLAASRQYFVVDKITNSHHEGFRLEGFDGQPESIESKDPFMDVERFRRKNIEKKTRRRHLQVMKGVEIMPHYINLPELRLDPQDSQENHYYPHEISELVMLETVIRLVKLAVACHKVLIPQKWIGSSIGLGFDCGTLPLRSEKFEDLRKKVIVDIFDWGRSVLDVVQDRTNLSIIDQKDYVKFWNSYTNGVTHLSWSAAHYYTHRFTNSSKWEKVIITIKDFDLAGNDDLVGSVEISLQRTEEKAYPIILNSNNFLMKSLARHKINYRGTLTCKIDWVSYPNESRIDGAWCVHILCANGIPNLDTNSLTDAYCVITAKSDEGHEFDQYTKIVKNSLDPIWDEKFEIPVMKSSYYLKSALQQEGLEAICHERHLSIFENIRFKNKSHRITDGALQLAFYEDVLNREAAKRRNLVYQRSKSARLSGK